MEDKNITFLFPSTVFSGHEKMALKIVKYAPHVTDIIHRNGLFSLELHSDKYSSYQNLRQLSSLLLKLKLKRNSATIIIVAGSPFGFLIEKILIKLFGLKLIEYVPVPELKEIKDKFHHHIMPMLNKALVNQRILLDDWQIQYSAVKKCSIIRNLVSND